MRNTRRKKQNKKQGEKDAGVDIHKYIHMCAFLTPEWLGHEKHTQNCTQTHTQKKKQQPSPPPPKTKRKRKYLATLITVLPTKM